MSTLPVVAFAMPAAISATIVASCDVEKVDASRPSGSRSSVRGPARAVALANDASLMRKIRRVCLTEHSCAVTGSSPACGSLMSSDSAHHAPPDLHLRARLPAGRGCSLSRRQDIHDHSKLPYAWHTPLVDSRGSY